MHTRRTVGCLAPPVDGLWLELARRRASTHPADAVTVFRRQSEAAVALAKRDSHDRALSLLVELRACHERVDALH